MRRGGVNDGGNERIDGRHLHRRPCLIPRHVDALGVGDQVGAGAAKVKVDKIYSPPKAEGAEILGGSTDEVVAGLMGKIKELGLL